LSVIRPGLAKIIEKVCISWWFESPETDLHIVLATVPVLDPARFIGLHCNALTLTKIDNFLPEPSL
jgi:hypothetical protein